MKTSLNIALFLLGGFFLLTACKDDEDGEDLQAPLCSENAALSTLDPRNFEMGFGTWIYGPTAEAREDTYDYVLGNGDIYLEHIDGQIPWSAWMDNTDLPQAFVDEVDYKVSKRPADIQLVLSVGALNTGRDDLMEDYDGMVPGYDSINAQAIEDAYFNHVKYLVEKLSPDYLISSIESNDFLVNSPAKWNDFRALMANVRFRLKQEFPNLPISESITLHNYFDVQVDDQIGFETEITALIAEMDFAAISFYPFFKSLHNSAEFQSAFDFLHNRVNIPIAFVETNQLAEDLVVPEFNTDIPGSVCGQKEYLETLFLNAQERDYHFVIWWAHRDYDALWETFPEEIKPIGRIWRDTGLLDEDGNLRPAGAVWQTILQR